MHRHESRRPPSLEGARGCGAPGRTSPCHGREVPSQTPSAHTGHVSDMGHRPHYVGQGPPDCSCTRTSGTTRLMLAIPQHQPCQQIRLESDCSGRPGDCCDQWHPQPSGQARWLARLVCLRNAKRRRQGVQMAPGRASHPEPPKLYAVGGGPAETGPRDGRGHTRLP